MKSTTFPSEPLTNVSSMFFSIITLAPVFKVSVRGAVIPFIRALILSLSVSGFNVPPSTAVKTCSSPSNSSSLVLLAVSTSFLVEYICAGSMSSLANGLLNSINFFVVS
ncbi:hypothetical protein WICPIJ_009108 [Wickerhamomyces pijperi]|uniref:Uncharacterized protein n=1 Tax=Wickerhamomyces pijperi TaxID=599730 RepID=A0A9P8PRU9_WICPI|nr:hypothetical protein WICPIJ_009108 [Wickerhamomyces pijperi]